MGKKLLKIPSYLYCINMKIEKKYNVFSSLNNLCTSIIYLTDSQANTGQYLANFPTFQALIFLCGFLSNQTLLFREIPYP